MQPDLPWNVAGIPPEAREAARAAARREGLSVGEWLTRRILKSLSDGAEPVQWPRPPATEYRAEEPIARDSEEMLARVSRSESESSGVSRRIEEQLRGLGRRLEATERTQSENSRAVNQAATEINIAAREQSQAFDQLGAHVLGLGDRLARVERGAAADGIKDAVKNLHDGLSRLADQIAQTTSKTASQISTLAGNVESVAGKIGDVRAEAENTAQALTARIAAFDERVRAVEGAAQTVSEKLDKTISGLDAARADERSEQADRERQAQLIARLSDALDRLSTRITSGEAQSAGAMARLEDQIAHVEARQSDSPFDRRLQGIEHALSDIAGRLESTERAASGTARTVEDNLRNFSTRLDAADKRNREAISESQARPVQPAPPPPPGVAAQPLPPAANFDLPPFPDTPTFAATPFAANPAELPPFQGVQPSFAADVPFPVDPFPAPVPESAESYIAAARRSARTAAAAEAQQGGRGALGAFTWGAAPALAAEQAPTKSGGPRFALVLGIVVIAIAAVVAGILLSRGLVGNASSIATAAPPPHLHTTTNPSADADEHTPDAVPEPSAGLSPPSAPVIVPRHAHKAVPTETTAVSIAPLPPTRTAAQTQAPARPLSTLDRLTNLATAGSAKAELLIGLKYLDGDGAPVNEAEAAKWLERAANQGEAIAAYRLGTLYERGHGVPADAAKAAQWYATAAKLGNRKAMHNLAVAYAEGSGMQKDLMQAAQWFSKAAALGLADSQFNLAVLYERGMGVQQSLIDAYKWYAIAAAQGDTESKARLDAISTQLSPDERSAAQKAAAEFHPLPLDRNANVPPDPSMVG